MKFNEINPTKISISIFITVDTQFNNSLFMNTLSLYIYRFSDDLTFIIYDYLFGYDD